MVTGVGFEPYTLLDPKASVLPLHYPVIWLRSGIRTLTSRSRVCRATVTLLLNVLERITSEFVFFRCSLRISFFCSSNLSVSLFFQFASVTRTSLSPINLFNSQESSLTDCYEFLFLLLRLGFDVDVKEQV